MNEHTNHSGEHESPDEMLNQAIESMRGDAVPAGPPAALIEATTAALIQSEKRTPRILRFIPRTRNMKIAVTAASLTVILGTATLWPGTDHRGTSAYAQVVGQVREARSMTYMTTISYPDESRQRRSKLYISANGRIRRESLSEDGSVQGVQISDEFSYPRMILEPRTKEVLVMRNPTEEDYVQPKRLGGRAQLELNRIDRLKQLASKPERELGEKTINGRRLAGFVGKRGEQEYSIWIDRASGQLVQIEYDFIETSMTGLKEIRERKAAHAVLSEFEFNPTLNASLFSLEVPAGYTLRARREAPAPGGEESIIEALRGYTQHSGGAFPASLTDISAWSRELAKNVGGRIPATQTLRAVAHLGAIPTFLVSLSEDDHAYLGSGKTIADKSAIIFWYKRQDGVFRAIYGDLMIKDVTAEDVANK